MIRRHSILFSLAALVFGASVYAQDTPKETAKEKADAPLTMQTPDHSPLTFSFGSDSYLGVFLEEVTSERVKELNLAEERGAVIMKIVAGSPAEKAGLKANDVIISFNGRRVDTVREIQRLLNEAPAGRTITLEVLRGGVNQTISATLGKRSPSLAFGGRADETNKLFGQLQQRQAEQNLAQKRLEEAYKDRLEFGKRSPLQNFGNYNFNLQSGLFRGSRLGVSVESMSEQLANYFGVKDGKGVLVTEVRESSAAARAGLKAGDVITEIDGQKVGNINELMSALAKKSEGTMAVKILRKGDEKTVTVTLEKVEPRERFPSRSKRAVVYSAYGNIV